MCGFSGILVFEGGLNPKLPGEALKSIAHRGPDYQETYITDKIGLAHSRLSIIDLSKEANQPFWSDDKRYVIVYNGEIYNYQNIREELKLKGLDFRTESDTEVLLKLWIEEREAGLQKLNGFFAFAIYDLKEESLFLARDRFGIKPLYYYHDDKQFLFSSEMSGLMVYDFPKKTDITSLYSYLQLNYLPGEKGILEGVKKIRPGYYLKHDRKFSETEKWYNAGRQASDGVRQYIGSQKTRNLEQETSTLRDLLEDSVRLRLISDVPLGGFLSGGLDSSIISALACRQTKDFRTFSIGFKDQPFHDESRFARQVASHIGSDHHEILLHSDDILASIDGILDRLPEPFADSSAIAVFILSREVRKEVTVALSGDGADELFGGYYKHSAEWYCRSSRILKLSRHLLKLSKFFPSSRAGLFSNINRQVGRLSDGLGLSNGDRYWQWCGIAGESDAALLLADSIVNQQDYRSRKADLTRFAAISGRSINPVLRNDLEMVLPGDMLPKVDLMSMANALEVRVPFLDHRVVEYAMQLPDEYKIKGKKRKIILRELAKELLPNEIISRKKHGFEVPLQAWLAGPLGYLLQTELLEKNFIESQQIFDFQRITKIRHRLFSPNPGDSAAQLWALIVFQHWWKRYM